MKDNTNTVRKCCEDIKTICRRNNLDGVFFMFKSGNLSKMKGFVSVTYKNEINECLDNILKHFQNIMSDIDFKETIRNLLNVRTND